MSTTCLIRKLVQPERRIGQNEPAFVCTAFKTDKLATLPTL